MSFWFGDFELDQERRQLLLSGEPVPLEPKAYELLNLLLECRPRALSRAQIRDSIWPQTFVSESTLAVAVNSIRHALSDDARAPRFIRTVHGFGYAFCGEARESGDARPGPSDAREDEHAPSPYPGLLAFTEREAAWFFGRETDVEALWEKIRRRKLLAVIGPSGVGKTSFLRAGVIPSRPPGWNVAYATPGTSPVSALARALVPDLAGDADAIDELLQGVQELSLSGESDRVLAVVRAWRGETDEALVVVDQFEELFALNALETQSRFASFLGRLPDAAGVHVLLSLRDDFLFSCSELASLRPVFEDLTPLTPPSPDALRRALLEPAARRGVRFDDDALVDEMVESVVSERGALPLLAFAVSRLWEERDRERKLLTRVAYERIDGVAGALAQHAEATLSLLGPERERVVREIFRNLVTAQGTRAAADRAELLSVFEEKREEAGAVLDALVDARLLTEYEAEGTPTSEASEATRAGGGTATRGGGSSAERREAVSGGETPATARGEAGHRRIEVVHESLLTHWPRLARWRTQEADGAQLRDQLKQAAHLWDERGRGDDLLWRGASFLDYRAWRARYAGRLSALEEEFGRATMGLAGRQRRSRWLAAAAIMAVLAVGLGVVGVLWTRSEAARQRANTEALRAEASKLLALGQAELERNPTAALAYVTKSLELADTEGARLFALRVLQDGPTELVAPAAPGTTFYRVAFSPNGEWLVEGGVDRAQLRRRGGGGPTAATARPEASQFSGDYDFGPENDLLVGNRSGDTRVWSVSDGREVRRLKGEEGDSRLFVRGHGLFTSTKVGERHVIRWAPLAQGDSRLVGTMDAAEVQDVDAAGARIAYVPGALWSGRRLYVRSLRDWDAPPRLIATHPAVIVDIAFHPDGRNVAAGDKAGKIRIWATDSGSERPLRILDSPGVIELTYSPRGRWLAAGGLLDAWYARLWDLTAPPATEPLRFPIFGLYYGGWAFDPSERWLAAAGLTLWPIGEAYPRSVGRHGWLVDNVAFAADGPTLVSASGGADSTVRVWSLSPDDPEDGRVLLRTLLNHPGLAVDASGKRVAISSEDRVFVMPLSGGSARELKGFSAGVRANRLAFSPDGRRVAAGGHGGPATENVIRIWSLEGEQEQVLTPPSGAGEGAAGGIESLEFVDDARLAAAGPGGVFLFDCRPGGHTRLLSSRPGRAVAVDGERGVVFAILGEPDEVVRFGLEGQPTTKVSACAGCYALAVDRTGTMVATDGEDGIVRIGPATGGEPHLFIGRASASNHWVAFSPDGRWVASSGDAPSVRLWPVPDVTRTPLHRRSHDELLATLHSWTNLRAVKDPQAPTGWKLEPGPFPGWAKLPQR